MVIRSRYPFCISVIFREKGVAHFMSYELRFFPEGSPDESEYASAIVTAEADNAAALAALNKNAEAVLKKLGETAAASAAGKITRKYKKSEKTDRYCFSAEDAIAAVFYACLGTDPDSSQGIADQSTDFIGEPGDLNGLTVTFEYNGDLYTDISEVCLIKSRPGICGVKFFAKKNRGRISEYYLLTGTVMGMTKYQESTVSRSPSAGIVKGGKLCYAGNRLCLQKEKGAEAVFPVHLFFESTGNDCYTFSVLIGGELYTKINKTHGTLTFFSTPVVSDQAPSVRAAFEFTHSNISQNYVNRRYSFSPDAYALLTAIEPPKIHRIIGSCPPGTAYEYYTGLEEALYKAFETSEKYRVTKEQLDHISDDDSGIPVNICRTGDSFTFRWKDAMINAVIPTVHKESSIFREDFSLSFPEFTVRSVTFAEEPGISVRFFNTDEKLNVEVQNEFTGKSFSGAVKDLSLEDAWDDLCLSKACHEVLCNELHLLRQVKEQVIRLAEKTEGHIFNDRVSNWKDRRKIAKKEISSRITALGITDPFLKEDIDKAAVYVADMDLPTVNDITGVICTGFNMYHQQEAAADSGIAKHVSSNTDFRNEALGKLCEYFEETYRRMYFGSVSYSDKKGRFDIRKNGETPSAMAVHEVGHALVCLLCNVEFMSITIISRTSYGGCVFEKEKDLRTKRDLENSIRLSMGGRACEEVIYGRDNIGDGASHDIQSVLPKARLMVEAYGFSDKFMFMPLSTDKSSLNGENREYNVSEGFREKIDEEVNLLLNRLYKDTVRMLSDKREVIIKLAEALYNAETLSAKEFKELYEKFLNEKDADDGDEPDCEDYNDPYDTYDDDF